MESDAKPKAKRHYITKRMLSLQKLDEKMRKAVKPPPTIEEELTIQEKGPDGVPLKRDPLDFLNNLFIEAVTRSFTNINQIIAKNQKKKDSQSVQRAAKKLQSKLEDYRELTSIHYEERLGAIEDKLR